MPPMLWAAVLPFQITCALIAVGYTAFVAAAPKFKMKRGHAALLGVPSATFGFIPLCLGVDALLSPFRFGEFHYETANEANDYHVRWSIPETARDITVHQANGGFSAHYAISREDLDAWLIFEWDRLEENGAEPWKPHSVVTSRTPELNEEPVSEQAAKWQAEQEAKLLALYWEGDFGGLGWPMPADVVKIEGAHARDAGSTYYYSESEGRAYQRASYF
ncbi:hypothetical protein [Alienimonas sp. DA493]|uniref:hypothetical protein n=1 Tax=Alienimonas sp. DA493 TaxID=3373605 RepID=UPI0037540402